MKTEMRTKKRCVLREDEPCVGCMQCMNIFSKKFLSAGKAKAKALIYTDMALSLLLPLTSISGLLLHAAGHGFPVWKGWFGLHGLFGSLFLLFSAIHVKLHWGWFRSMKLGLKRKSRITVFLSLLFLAVSVSGIALAAHLGGFHLGLFHYQTGLIFGVLGIWHMVRRFPVLMNMRRNKTAR